MAAQWEGGAMAIPQGETVDPKAPIRPTDPVPQPTREAQLCRVCGHLLHAELKSSGTDVHPGCSFRVNQPIEEPGTNHPMRTTLIDVIRITSRESIRSRQLMVGPSELGGTCTRRLAMRIAGLRTVNRSSDPWPSIVGTATHDWLQRAFEGENRRLRAAGQPERWITEQRIEADPICYGTSDLYDRMTQTVIDWKSVGTTSETKLHKEGPSEGYQTQIQAYGLGFVRAGFPVRAVALMFLPRSGKLASARYYEWPFDPARAQQAIARVYTIARRLGELREQLGADWADTVWPIVPPDVTALCGWCPFYNRSVETACSDGCPGR